MKDVLFYCEQIDEGRLRLNEEEMRHAVKVLRYRKGDEIRCTDGKGHFFLARLSETGKHEAWAEVISKESEARPATQLTIAVAPTKSFDRMSWCMEKLTEIGADVIVPIHCERGERNKWKEERALKVLISALKQSKRAYLPELAPMTDFGSWVMAQSMQSLRLIAHISDSSLPLASYDPTDRDVCICIGPEGDFTENEISLAISAGFRPLSLGPYRLRTETAAIFASAGVQILRQKNLTKT